MIHYHGTPLTPRSELLRCAGHHFCVSFANPQDADICRDIAQSIMFDCGAFSMYTQGIEIDWLEYYRWLAGRLMPPHWAVIPDKINGTEEENNLLLKGWPFDPFLSAPVWHMHESLGRLGWLVDNWPRVCIGSSGEYWDVGSASWCARMDVAFNYLEQWHALGKTWIHMLRGLALSGSEYPFASADSVNVARNYKDIPGRGAVEMMREIDARQCPPTWHPRMVQQELVRCGAEYWLEMAKRTGVKVGQTSEHVAGFGHMPTGWYAELKGVRVYASTKNGAIEKIFRIVATTAEGQ